MIDQLRQLLQPEQEEEEEEEEELLMMMGGDNHFALDAQGRYRCQVGIVSFRDLTP